MANALSQIAHTHLELGQESQAEALFKEVVEVRAWVWSCSVYWIAMLCAMLCYRRGLPERCESARETERGHESHELEVLVSFSFGRSARSMKVRTLWTMPMR